MLKLKYTFKEVLKMNEKVAAYIEAQKACARAEYESETAKTLIELGIFEKEYSPSQEYNDKYPLSEYDYEKQVYKYYRHVPVEISDEDYEELKKYTGISKSKRSAVATMLIVIAVVVYVFGFIGSCFLVDLYDVAGLIVGWVATFISGTLYLGFAAIVQLLYDIKNK